MNKRIIRKACPLISVTLLIITAAIFFYGIKILLALRDSKRFRENSMAQSQPRDDFRFLVTTIILSLIFQLLKANLRVVKIILDVRFVWAWRDCFTGIPSYSKYSSCARPALLEFSKQDLFLKESWCYFLEVMILTCLTIRKMIVRGKNSRQGQGDENKERSEQ